MRGSGNGNYYKICGRTRANEKFSGKGYKNHICEDCSSRFGRKAKRNNLDKGFFVSENTVLLYNVPIQTEAIYFDDNLFSEICFKDQNLSDEELPF